MSPKMSSQPIAVLSIRIRWFITPILRHNASGGEKKVYRLVSTKTGQIRFFTKNARKSWLVEIFSLNKNKFEPKRKFSSAWISIWDHGMLPNQRF